MAKYNDGAIDWGFIFNWTFMSIAGLIIGTTARRFIFSIVFGVVGGGVWGKVIEGAVIGAAIGLAQQFALPPQIPRSGGWVIASIVGWAVGWGLGWSFGWRLLGVGGFGANFALIGFAAGLMAGVGQWLILRNQLEQAYWWLAASPLAWAIGMWAGMTLRGALGWPVAGGVAGLMTAGVLTWLLQQDKAQLTTHPPEPASDFSASHSSLAKD